MNKLKRMLQRHFVMIDLLLQGLSHKDIALRLGCTPQCVSMVHKSPVVQEELARRRKEIDSLSNKSIGVSITEAKQVLEEAALKAARTHVNLLASQDEAVAQRSASAILDRTGITSKDKNDTSRAIVIEAETVNLLNIAADESLSPVREALDDGSDTDNTTARVASISMAVADSSSNTLVEIER